MPESSCALATVSYGGHFRVLLQFYLSFAANILDPMECKLLVLVSTEAEVGQLTSLLRAKENAARLQAVLPQLTIVDLPSALQQLSPKTKTPLPTAKNRGVHGRLYVCVKKAFAARYAHEVLDASQAIVTDSEAYVWKPMSLSALFQDISSRPTVWYADAPVFSLRNGAGILGAGRKANATAHASTRSTSGHTAHGTGGSSGSSRGLHGRRLSLAHSSSPGHIGGGIRRMRVEGANASSSMQHLSRAPRASQVTKARHGNGDGNLAKVDANWCSLHVFGDARGLTRAAMLERVPSPTASLFESMLFSYPRDRFRAYWSAV